MRLIAKAIRISSAKFHRNRLTTVQYIHIFRIMRVFLGHSVENNNLLAGIRVSK